MLPRSDDLEVLFERLKTVTLKLGRMKGAEITQQALKSELADLARTWLRLSPLIREAACCKIETLSDFDSRMSELLASTTTRTRSSTIKKKLDFIVSHLVDAVIVPIIQVEGSPRHVAGRAVEGEFSSLTTAEEASYVEEAARCVTVGCYRAAIIMLWAAAVARLHAFVIVHGFAKYNEAVDALSVRKGNPFNRINPSAKISSLPELQRSRDSDLIIIGMEVIGYDLQTYQELDRLLGQRNDCAHPGMNSPGALDVQQFASKLRRLVFEVARVAV